MTTLRDIATRAVPDLLSAFGLLTRLPLPNHRSTGAGSAWAWPLVGATLGGIAAGVVWLALFLGVTPGVASALVLTVLALLTGGLHEDGLSDTADGFFGGWTKQRRLEIMKDSRVGSYGVLALVLVTLARWSALTALLVHGGYAEALIATGAISRAPMGVMMALLPNARGEGLSQATGRPTGMVALFGTALALAIAYLATDLDALTLAAVAFLTLILVSLSALRRVGGQTGDVLGALQQLTELACLAVLSARAG